MTDANEGGKGDGKVSLGEHMRRIRGLVKPENCARPRKQARAAANARWAAVKQKKTAEAVAGK